MTNTRKSKTIKSYDPEKKPAHIKKLNIEGDPKRKTRRTFWVLHVFYVPSDDETRWFSGREIEGVDPGQYGHSCLYYSTQSKSKVESLTYLHKAEVAEEIAATMNAAERRRALKAASTIRRRAAGRPS